MLRGFSFNYCLLSYDLPKFSHFGMNSVSSCIGDLLLFGLFVRYDLLIHLLMLLPYVALVPGYSRASPNVYIALCMYGKTLFDFFNGRIVISTSPCIRTPLSQRWAKVPEEDGRRDPNEYGNGCQKCVTPSETKISISGSSVSEHGHE